MIVYSMEELARYADEWARMDPRPEADWERAFALAAAQLDPGDIAWIHRDRCPADDATECTCRPFRIEKAEA